MPSAPDLVQICAGSRSARREGRRKKKRKREDGGFK